MAIIPINWRGRRSNAGALTVALVQIVVVIQFADLPVVFIYVPFRERYAQLMRPSRMRANINLSPI